MALVAAWALTIIALPIIQWTLGPVAIQDTVVVGALVQLVVVLEILKRIWGAGRVLRVSLLVVMLTWAAEVIGSSSGFLFGQYEYTSRLQPQLLGVPLLVPLAWLMMLPPAWAVAQAILLPSRLVGWQRRLVFAGVSALAITAWDLFLDPQMVAWNYWVWQPPGGYFGIPWTNYLGWLLVSGLITALVHPLILPEGPLLLVYAGTWLVVSIGQFFFWGLPGPALAGFAAMGGMLLWAWRQRTAADQGVARLNVKKSSPRPLSPP